MGHPSSREEWETRGMSEELPRNGTSIIWKSSEEWDIHHLEKR